MLVVVLVLVMMVVVLLLFWRGMESLRVEINQGIEGKGRQISSVEEVYSDSDPVFVE